MISRMEPSKLLGCPPEILLFIIEHLPFEDQQKLRLVSTGVAQLTNNVLFRHVTFNNYTISSFINAGSRRNALARHFRCVRFDGGAPTRVPLMFEAQETNSSVRKLLNETILIEEEQDQRMLMDDEENDTSSTDDDDGFTMVNEEEDDFTMIDEKEDDFLVINKKEAKVLSITQGEANAPGTIDGDARITPLDDEDFEDIVVDDEESDYKAADEEEESDYMAAYDEEESQNEERGRFSFLNDEDEGYSSMEVEEDESEHDDRLSFLNDDDDDDSRFLKEEQITHFLSLLPKNTLIDVMIDIRTSHTFGFMEPLLSLQQNLRSLQLSSYDCEPYAASINKALEPYASNMQALRKVQIKYRGDDNDNTIWRFWGRLLEQIPCVKELELTHDSWEPMQGWELSFATGLFSYWSPLADRTKDPTNETYRICDLRQLTSLKLNKIHIQLENPPKLLPLPENDQSHLRIKDTTRWKYIIHNREMERRGMEKKAQEPKPPFPSMERLELVDCRISPEMVRQLHVFFPQLKELIYTDNDDEEDSADWAVAETSKDSKLARVQALNESLFSSSGLRSLYFHINGCSEMISVNSILKHHLTLKHLGIGSCTDLESYYSLPELAKIALCKKLKSLAIGLPSIAVDVVSGSSEMTKYVEIFNILSQLGDLEALRILQLPYVPHYWNYRTPDTTATGSLGGDYLQGLKTFVFIMALILQQNHSNVHRISFGPRHCDWLAVRNKEGMALDWDEWNPEDCESGDKKTNDFDITKTAEGLPVATAVPRDGDGRVWPPTDLVGYI